MIIKKEEIIENLTDARGTLAIALLQLKELNNDTQFDYCTSSELSGIADDLIVYVRALGKIIYQKDGAK
jgi:hypothetical protein